MMRELSLPVRATAVASHYRSLLDGFVLDEADAALANSLDPPCLVAATLMVDNARKRDLADKILAFAGNLRAEMI